MRPKAFNGWNWITLSIVLFFALFILFPVVLVLNKSIYNGEAGRFTLEHFSLFLNGSFIG